MANSGSRPDSPRCNRRWRGHCRPWRRRRYPRLLKAHGQFGIEAGSPRCSRRWRGRCRPVRYRRHLDCCGPWPIWDRAGSPRSSSAMARSRLPSFVISGSPIAVERRQVASFPFPRIDALGYSQRSQPWGSCGESQFGRRRMTQEYGLRRKERASKIANSAGLMQSPGANFGILKYVSVLLFWFTFTGQDHSLIVR